LSNARRGGHGFRAGVGLDDGQAEVRAFEEVQELAVRG